MSGYGIGLFVDGLELNQGCICNASDGFGGDSELLPNGLEGFGLFAVQAEAKVEDDLFTLWQLCDAVVKQRGAVVFVKRGIEVVLRVFLIDLIQKGAVVISISRIAPGFDADAFFDAVSVFLNESDGESSQFAEFRLARFAMMLFDEPLFGKLESFDSAPGGLA